MLIAKSVTMQMLHSSQRDPEYFSGWAFYSISIIYDLAKNETQSLEVIANIGLSNF